jgi:hypothetical protein
MNPAAPRVDRAEGPAEQEAERAAQMANKTDRGSTEVRGVPILKTPVAQPGPMLQRQAIEFEVEPNDPSRPGQINFRLANPREHANYVDRRLTAVGYSIYLGGYILYCEGLPFPVFLSEAYIDTTLTNAASVSNSIYPDRASAMADIPLGPWAPGQPTPYAFYEGAGGALVVPTVFSPATTPLTIQTLLAARRQLAEAVQQDLTVVAIGLVGGMVLRAVVSVIARVGGGRASRGTPPEEPPGGGPMPSRQPAPEPQRSPAPVAVQPPAPTTPSPTPTPQRRSAGVPTTGTRGSQAASVRQQTRVSEGGERGPRAPSPGPWRGKPTIQDGNAREGWIHIEARHVRGTDPAGTGDLFAPGTTRAQLQGAAEEVVRKGVRISNPNRNIQVFERRMTINGQSDPVRVVVDRLDGRVITMHPVRGGH